MLLVLIVVPCTLIAAATVAALDRAGILPRLEAGPTRSPSLPALSTSRAAMLCAIVIMVTWVLAWLVALVVGLSIILGSN